MMALPSFQYVGTNMCCSQGLEYVYLQLVCPGVFVEYNAQRRAGFDQVTIVYFAWFHDYEFVLHPVWTRDGLHADVLLEALWKH